MNLKDNNFNNDDINNCSKYRNDDFNDKGWKKYYHCDNIKKSNNDDSIYQ